MLLSLILILALICTLTESARVSCINAKLKGITYMAADSCFSEFAREIFDDYGIMALWKTDGGLIASYNDYLQKNLDFSDTGLYTDADLYLISHDASALSDVKRITDDSGYLFEMQVYEYMDYYLVKEALEKLLEYIDIYRAGGKVSSFISKINEYRDVFIRLATAAARIQRTVDKAKSLAYNPKTILEYMKYGLDQYIETEEPAYISYFNSGYWALKDGKNRLKIYLMQIGVQTDEFNACSEKARDAVSELQKIIDSDGTEYDQELLAGLQEQLNDIKLKTADKEADYYHIEENSRKAEIYGEKLDYLDDFLNVTDTWNVSDNAKKYSEVIDQYYGIFQDFDLDSLGLNMTEYSGGQQDAGFLSVIGDLFSDGLLKATAGNKISKKKIGTGDMPSVTDAAGSYPGTAPGPWRQMEFGEYVVSHFGCFTDVKKDTALEYETEYILSGRDTDKENLKKVIKELVMMRSGLNMAAFMKDVKKMEEAEILARSVVGFTGLELLVQLIKLLIISMWCIAESLCDVKALLSGEKIPLVKGSDNWAVSASGLSRFRKSLVPAVTDENGISYEDHLRILLFLEGRKKRTYRTMDMIQADACKKYEAGFRMNKCVASAKFHTAFNARQLFVNFGFVSNMTGSGNGKYDFSFVQDYAYVNPDSA